MPEPVFLTIAIPSYNRPTELRRLLDSVDCRPDRIDILVCEDHSPGRALIREAVNDFTKNSPYVVHYHENSRNLGYDGNIRNLVEHAEGRYILFMGDDDLFIPEALDSYLEFLDRHQECKYILRSYIAVHEDGTVENFRYLPETTEFPPGEETVAWLFKRSVSLSGFTIDREVAAACATDDLDGTLLYQIYLMAEACLQGRSIYCAIPVTQAWQTFRDDYQMFGSSDAEKGRYTPGSVSLDNSINFTSAYFEVARYLDRKHGTTLEHKIRLQLSKYSYPFLSIQRKRGLGQFLAYAKRLETELGFGVTWYFYLYKWALVLFGERLCDRIILLIKKTLGYTPEL